MGQRRQRLRGHHARRGWKRPVRPLPRGPGQRLQDAERRGARGVRGPAGRQGAAGRQRDDRPVATSRERAGPWPARASTPTSFHPTTAFNETEEVVIAQKEEKVEMTGEIV